MAQSDYEDLFPEDDLDFEEPQFPDEVDDDYDDFPGTGDDGEGGVSRAFVILAAVLAVIFVILVAVGAALVIGGDECDERCLQATVISETNAKIESDIRASETSIALASTADFETQVAVNATETQVAFLQATATQDTVNTAVAATETQVSVDSTATQVNFERGATQTAIAEFTDTPVPTVAPTEEIAPTDDETITEGIGGGDVGTDGGESDGGDFDGQLSNLPTTLQGRTLTVCIFRDNGDGQFNPSAEGVTDPNCVPAVAEGSQPLGEVTPTASTGGTTGSTTGGAVPQATTAVSSTPAAGGGAAPTTAPLNPIFQTATAAAGGSSGGSGAIPPSPTAEGSSFNPALYIPVGRSHAQQQGEDTFVDSVTTDAQGRFILPDLPPGQYWFAIGDAQLQINVRDTVGEQVFNFPQDDGTVITIVVPAQGGSQEPTLSPIFQTATAVAGGNTVNTPTQDSSGGVGGPVVTPTSLASTGLFDGEGGDVTTTDLLILALIGGVLIGVVFAARRMRSAA